MNVEELKKNNFHTILPNSGGIKGKTVLCGYVTTN